MVSARLLLPLLALVSAWLLLRSGSASAGELPYYSDEIPPSDGYVPPWEPAPYPEPELQPSEWFPSWSADPMQNVAAFLAMIRAAEGTEPNSYGLDPYRVTYGYQHVIEDLSDHPTVLGEWGPVPGPSGPTSAAGAYQITATTWRTVVQPRAIGKHGRALSFAPADQDAAAVILLEARGAYDDVAAGRFHDAVNKLGDEWASLPSATVNQPRISIARAQQLYLDAGGTFA